MSNYITIPLSKKGKNAGKYEAIVSVLAYEAYCKAAKEYHQDYANYGDKE